MCTFTVSCVIFVWILLTFAFDAVSTFTPSICYIEEQMEDSVHRRHNFE